MAALVASSSKPPTKPPVVQPSSGNAIIINPCQRLNPILECIRNVNKEFGDIVPDFQLGRTTCALFLSLKYHRLHPEYIHQRIERLGNAYNLRILLLMCDVSEHQDPIRELTKTCLINNMTIIVAWTPDEAGMYLATYKAFEHKPPDTIKERVDKDYYAILKSALTSVNKVNSTDVETLRTSFGSFANISKATPEQLQKLPGFGQVKVRRLKDAFDKPFRNNTTPALSSSSSNNIGSASQGQAPASTQKSRMPANSGVMSMDKGKGKAVERPLEILFGSAADMQSPSIPPQVTSRQREPSPPWDIELDLNDHLEFDEPVSGARYGGQDKGQITSGEQALRAPGALGSSGTVSRDGEEGRRRESPVWDIELDLNSD